MTKFNKIYLLFFAVFIGLVYVNNNLLFSTFKSPADWFHTYNPTGSYHISQQQDNGWVEKYVQSYTAKFQAKTFILEPLNNQIKIRVVQKTVPYGDIEYVALRLCDQNITPQYARYVDTNENVLNDIAADDLNIIVSHERPIEILWQIPSLCIGNATLTLMANEYTSLEKDALRFPNSNIETQQYRFLNNGSLNIDGKINEVDGKIAATYSPFWIYSTGNPSAYTYIYVMDDPKYVYFAVDITGDNSNEFGVDWLKVIVHDTSSNIDKEFRVDDYNAEYGKCSFGLTSKVTYKHTSCEIRIPKSELNLNSFNFKLRYYGSGSCGDTGGSCGEGAGSSGDSDAGGTDAGGETGTGDNTGYSGGNPYPTIAPSCYSVIWGPCSSTRGPGTQSGEDGCTTYSQSCCTPGNIIWGACSSSVGAGTQSGEDGCTTYSQSCCIPDCANKCGGSPDGCGGTCSNPCTAGQVCNAGTCCMPDCTNKCGGTASTNCGGTGVCAAVCPSPIHIGGNFIEDLSGNTVSCIRSYIYTNDEFYKKISLQNPAINKTMTCSSTNTSYSCDITFSNLDADRSATLVLNQSVYGYNTSLDCQGNTRTITLNSGQTVNNNIFFTLENKNWFKLKNASLNSATSKLSIPYNVVAYDSSDDGSRKLIINEAGIITNGEVLSLVNNPPAKFSEYDNVIDNYSTQKTFGSIDSIVKYIKNKGKYKTIGSLMDILPDDSNTRLFLLTGNATINSAVANNLKNKSIFIIVTGNVNFSEDLNGIFSPTNSSIVLAANTINFFTANGTVMKEATGIFMSENLYTGLSKTDGLKVIGNLISLGTNQVQNDRVAGTFEKPGLYVVFDPSLYIKSLETFSWNFYSWRGE